MLRYVEQKAAESGDTGWISIVTPDEKDVSIYAVAVGAGKTERFKVAEGRRAYMVLTSGEAEVNGVVSMTARDALEVTEEEIEIKAACDAHIVLTETRRT